MSSIVALGLLWAAAGAALGLECWRERATTPGPGERADAVRARFGRGTHDGSWRRLQAMRRAYASGATTVSVGFLVNAPALLAVGAAMVNLGTIYRYLVVALDHAALDTPLLARSRRAARHVARHARLAQPTLGGALVSRLAD